MFKVHSNLVFFFNFQITKIRSKFVGNDIVAIIYAGKKKCSGGPSILRCHENWALQELKEKNNLTFIFISTNVN